MEDARTFAAFYAANRATVLAAVRATLGEAPLAADAVDEAFVRAAERWSSVRTFDRPAAWTYRVAVNWARSWRRKWSLRPSVPAEDLDREHDDVLPDLDLARALAVLPVEQREMLVLRDALGCSVREVAELVGVAEGTVKSGVHRARRRLRDEGWWYGVDEDDREEVPDGRA